MPRGVSPRSRASILDPQDESYQPLEDVDFFLQLWTKCSRKSKLQEPWSCPNSPSTKGVRMIVLYAARLPSLATARVAVYTKSSEQVRGRGMSLSVFAASCCSDTPESCSGVLGQPDVLEEGQLYVRVFVARCNKVVVRERAQRSQVQRQRQRRHVPETKRTNSAVSS
ncbi:hypothetical protein BAUCODRAFT_172688 [Baudoinia panamericana UAMH 10762]|uniref:Uncharacterized protein n=1 Tax=Baudoinia panamericana (strain UAMH 10762) TaxID=717646 RepID=M2N8S6_BAUPA|nr:uncharacterized protein BAUCODRAFT_172688 [Baudoinia panamericana UAMH 10762]EMD00534.1 hypothetical protein BAUCODRAFT_172688 [Baudoinia panamericana UAMH 10762]